MLPAFAAFVAFFGTLGLSERLAAHVNAPRTEIISGRLPAAQPVAMAARATVTPTSCAGYACRLKD